MRLRDTGAVAMVLLLAGGTVQAEPSRQRRTELLYLLHQDCGSCHGMTLKGGLGPPLLPAALEGKPVEDLAETILRGRPTTPMPPWAFEISNDEAAWLATRLREGRTDAP